MTLADHWDHFLARWGVKRNKHRVEPGLYALGNPTPISPVFVTANYTLSFDALRSALAGIDGYILVLNTYGINVWCAAGKGTFGTEELVRRIEATQLHQVVNHRVLIVPQLGAPSVAAHTVKQRSGFKVEYGPANAATAWWLRTGWVIAHLLGLPPVTAYLALNFTGATPFTSKSSVKREMAT